MAGPLPVADRVHDHGFFVGVAVVHHHVQDGREGLVAHHLGLCGHAHQITSALAVRAAQGEAAALSGRDAAALQLETLREHLRRLWLDWPRVLRGEASIPVDRLQSLHGCPALQGLLSRLAVEPEAVLAPTRDWLETHVFGEPLTVWLLHWLRGGEAALADWCHRTDTLPARLLRDVRAAAQAVRTTAMGLPLMVLLFVLFPRIAPLWGVPSDAVGKTGLSNEMQFGAMSEIANDDSIASCASGTCPMKEGARHADRNRRVVRRAFHRSETRVSQRDH